MKISFCKSSEYNMSKHRPTVILRCTSRDTVTLSFFGGSFEFERIDLSPSEIGNTAKDVEVIARRILDCNVLHPKSGGSIAFCSYFPVQNTGDEYYWIRLFQAGFLKHSDDYPKVNLDFYSQMSEPFYIIGVKENYLPKATSKIFKDHSSCIKYTYKLPEERPEFDKWYLGISRKIDASISRNEKRIADAPKSISVVETKRNLLKNTREKVEAAANDPGSQKRFEELLNTYYERRAVKAHEESPDYAPDKKIRTTGGWRKAYHTYLYHAIEPSEDIQWIKNRVNNVEKGESLKNNNNNRLLLLLICYDLHMNLDETGELFRLGGLDTNPVDKKEAIFMTLIELKVFDSPERFTLESEILSRYGLGNSDNDLYDLVARSLNHKSKKAKKKIKKTTKKRKTIEK